jgi:adenine-specific DNA-methyltransferase
VTELLFKGKEFVFNHHLTVPFRPLVPHPDKGVGPASLDQNLIIHGDNLHGLKALLPLYAGKVDCIFIDPPYNTGAEGWCYNDNVNSPMIREWLSANPVGIEDGLRHDKWCAMMWPRLRLLKELLTDEGLIFISINSGELARLKLICDEIFGADAYIGEFVWKSRNNKDNRNEDGLSNDHEFILIYGSALDGELRAATDYTNPDGDIRGAWASANMVGLASKEKRPNLHFDLINPDTGINYGCPKKGWRFEPATMTRLITERRIIWPEKKDGRPRRKAFLKELDARTNVSSVLLGQFYTNDGSKTFDELMPGSEFPFPKPKELITFILSCFERKDLTVLDSFAGTGTTAHAVLEANKLDAGNRRFILVEAEDYAEALTAERVKRVINGYTFKGNKKSELMRKKINLRVLEKADVLISSVRAIENLHGHEYDQIKKEVKNGELVVTGEKAIAERTEGLGGTFTYCTLGEAIEIDALLSGNALPAQETLAALLWHMATASTFDRAELSQASEIGEGVARLGAHGGRTYWLIYRPDLPWLKSAEAALSLARARAIATTGEGEHLVFAPAKFVSRELLAREKLRIEYAPLPFALYKLETA